MAMLLNPNSIRQIRQIRRVRQIRQISQIRQIDFNWLRNLNSEASTGEAVNSQRRQLNWVTTQFNLFFNSGNEFNENFVKNRFHFPVV